MAGFTDTVNLQINAIGNFSNVIGEVNKLQSRLQSLKLPKNLGDESARGITELQQKFENLQNLVNRGIKTKADFNNFERAAKEVDIAARQVEKSLNSISDKKIKINMADTDEIKKKIQELEQFKKEAAEIANLKSFNSPTATGVFNSAKIDEIKNSFGAASKGAKYFQDVINGFKSGNIDKATTSLEKFLSYARQYEKTLNDSGGNNRGTKAVEWATQAQAAISGADAKIKEFNSDINQMRADNINKMTTGLNSFKSQFSGIHSSIRQTTQEMRNMASSTMNMQSQLGMLRTQADYFFGLQNMIQLFRRGLQDTIQTVKDLDKAMTDTAVVTDMTVSELWAQLPDYTKLANKLGATTQGAYETMTLYYQQGLNKEETFEIGEETMKMARIAGLDYAQTTNMMTAALRGFNMELNQTSAKRVNDVYSELAAITASDTRELGLAMERTASIAHSAGMDFGNTTAFLAQMIETTREAPENLGTAMKTIIARFQELKENPYQISEVEGEEVDFNRVDKALKSIGVDLMDNRDKFRDLDDVFMDISEKWDGLSQTQQRYIATIAAGSRQQSRFLAMVGNYDRLKQLTDAAANSEGASDVQFSKTLESMEAKLNKLHNAWDQFMMGITNSDLIKGMTGVAVKVLDAINKIESGIESAGDHIGGVFGDIFKSITSFTALLLGFKGIGKATNIGIGMLGNILGAGKGTGASFFGGATGMRQASNMAQANAISSPIVAAINRLTAVVQGGKIKGNDPTNIRSVGRQGFKNRNEQLRSLAITETKEGRKKQYTANTFGVRDFSNVFKDLNIEDQAALYRGQKGTRQAIQRSFAEGVKKLNVSEEANQAANRFYTDLDYAMASGSHQVQEGLTKAFDPVQLGREIGGDTGKEITKAALDKRKQIIKQGQALNLSGKDLENYWRTQESNIYGSAVGLNDDEIKDLTSRMTGLTSVVNGTGSAFMQLGFTFQSLGLEGLGSVISTFGSSLMSVGMMAETAGHGLSVLKKEAAGAYAALAGAAPLLAAAGAVFALAFAAYKIDQKRIADIRKSGKEVVDAYEETTKSVQENLNKLDKIDLDWNKWSQGVDANGNNINLGTEEYQDYKKAVKEITDMHPELIKGYNAEGEAIVDNSTALKEAVKLEQEREKTATKNYLDEGQKIVDRRNSTKRWQKGESQQLSPSVLSRGAGAYSIEKSDIEKDAQEVTSAIKEIDGGEELLTKWGVTFDKLGNITQEGINILRDRGGDIQNELEKTWENPTEAQQLLLNNSQDAIAQLGEDFKGIEEVSKETFDALKTYATDQGIFENIDADLVAPFQNALQRISEQDLSWNELKSATDELGKTYQDLGGHAEEFRKIQSKVDEAQKEFGQNLDTQAYEKRVKNLTKPMDEWITELRSSSNQADQILADWVENQKARMTDLSKETVELSDAFNVMSGRITSANSAYDNWTSQNEEGDLYTASDNFKKMLEEVNDGVDDLGKGSQQWWTAAQSMFGDEYVLEHSKKEIQSHMNQVKQYLKEGQEGVDNFMIDLRDNKLDKELDEDILGVKKNGAPYTIGDFIKVDDDGALNFDKLGEAPDEAFTAIAQALGMSDDLLTSLMNKARQFGDIKFGNVDQMRAALAASDSTIVGNDFTNGNKNIYVKESDFDTQALEALGSGDEVKEYKKDLEKLGTVFMGAASSINKGELSKYIQDWGIKTDKYQTNSGEKHFQTTTDAFIRYLDKVGYNKDEIQQMYDTATSGKKSLITDADKVDFSEAYQTAKQKNADPSFQAVTSIEGNVSGILGVTQSIAAAMGILTSGENGSKKQISNKTEEANEHAEQLFNGTSDKSYEEAKSSLEEDISSLKETKAVLEQGQSNYEKNSKGWLEYQAHIDEINSSLNTAEAVLNTVTKTQYESIQNQRQLQQNKVNVEDFVSQNKKLSTNYQDTAIDKNNNLNADKFNSLIDSVRKTTEDKNTQNNVIGQYLQNSSKTLVDQKASNQQIASSIQAAAQEMANNKMKPADIAAALNQGYGTNLTKKDVETTEDGEVKLNLDDSNLQKQLSNLQADVTANIVAINAAASGQNNSNSVFHRVGTMARGSRKGYTISGRPTLTGEEGEELVWEPRRNEAYMVGSNGPQFANISKNAIVWNAEQTKRIKKNSSFVGNIGTGARGITPVGTMALIKN